MVIRTTVKALLHRKSPESGAGGGFSTEWQVDELQRIPPFTESFIVVQRLRREWRRFREDRRLWADAWEVQLSRDLSVVSRCLPLSQVTYLCVWVTTSLCNCISHTELYVVYILNVFECQWHPLTKKVKCRKVMWPCCSDQIKWITKLTVPAHRSSPASWVWHHLRPWRTFQWGTHSAVSWGEMAHSCWNWPSKSSRSALG